MGSQRVGQHLETEQQQNAVNMLESVLLLMVMVMIMVVGVMVVIIVTDN